MSERKNYWLALPFDFLDTPEMRVVLGMDNGKDYLVFWMRLLILAAKQAEPGALRISREVPYNDKSLADATLTNVDAVRSAMRIFAQMKMLYVEDDQTIMVPQAAQMVKSETAAAARMRLHREKERREAAGLLEALPEQERSAPQPARQETEQTATEYPEDFETFWQAYPRKVEKRAAFKAWKATRKKGAEVSALMTATNAYAAEVLRKRTEDQYIKHASTWLGPSAPWQEYVNGDAKARTREEAAAARFGR